MKKLTQNFQASLFGRISIILISFLIPHTLLFLFYKFVLPLDRTLYSKDQAKAIAWVWISLWIVLPFLTYRIAKWRRWDIDITKRVMIAFQRKKERLEQKLLGLQHKLRESRLSIQKSYYKPVSMVFTNTPDAPFDFILKLSAPLVRDQQQKPLLPIVIINDIQVAVKECPDDPCCVVLFTRKAITHEKEFLDIKIGNEILMEPNPFWIDKQCKDTIVWQCQGHGFERIMMLSPSYFPKAPKGFYIPCYVKVHKELHGPYFGVLDETGNDIIIKLNKDFGEKDTKQKDSILVFEFGISKHKIWLPDPSLLTRDGQLVA